MTLDRYRTKRKFGGTPEPAPEAKRGRRARDPIFVVQLHHARNRHYDFRLEIDGALKSWAVPKGPSLRPGEKRLAIEVEDHPLAYADFAGDIPQGHYGAGHVDIFDRGTWTAQGDAITGLAAGKLEFELHGERLRGGWKLVRTQLRGRQPQWLLLKRDDTAAADIEADDLLDKGRISDAGSRKSAKQKETAKFAMTAAVKKVVDPGSLKTGAATKPRARNESIDWTTRAQKLPNTRKTKLPAFVSPQLTLAAAHPPMGEDWLHEVKWDGYRLLAAIERNGVSLWSRNQLDWSLRLPELAAALQAAPPGTRLDGELIALDNQGRSDFSALQRALKAKQTGALRYALFDLPALAGIDLRRAPLQARKALLEDWIARVADSRLVYSSHSIGNGAAAFAASAQHGLEGIISKRVDAPYQSGRGEDWRKLRHVQADEFLVIGYTDPQAGRSGFGSLLLARVERGKLHYMGRVGSGFDAMTLATLSRQLRALKRTEPVVELPAHVPFSPRSVHWVQPQQVVEVAYRGLGKEGLLRQASFKVLREDKGAVDLGLREEQPMGKKATARKGAKPTPANVPTVNDKAVRKVALKRKPVDSMPHLSSPERVVYRGSGITKGDVADYYRRVSRWLLPAVAGRPLSLLRCPDGVGGECFFQKNHEPSLGAHVRALPLKTKDGSRVHYVAIDDEAGLLELVQMNTIELHPWGATGEDPEHPDVLVFDLDPGPKVAWPTVIGAARELRARLLEVGLHSWPRLSGGKGIHVVLPIAPVHDWPTAKEFCEAFAKTLAQIAPQRYVAVASKALRERRIFIDWLRNGRGATSVASWSLRARPGAPVAMPLRWDELGRAKSGADYDLAKALRRAAGLRRDPWHDWEQHRTQRLPE